jgi:hypothetical protein
VIENKISMVEELVGLGADVNASDDEGLQQCTWQWLAGEQA